jgi:hypothetical protein
VDRARPGPADRAGSSRFRVLLDRLSRKTRHHAPSSGGPIVSAAAGIRCRARVLQHET